jgi:HPt (histidine-containing phosphotransfer) domain-containing protein
MKGDQERCLTAGMDAYLAKPIKPDALYALLADLAPPAANGSLKVLVNWSEALSQVRGDERLLRELAAIFVAQWPVWRADLETALAQSDADEIRRSAHTVKGSLGTFAADQACAAASDLEAAARDRRFEDIREAIARLDRELAGLLPALAAFGDGGPT